MEITKFINGNIVYDNYGQYFWIKQENGIIQMLAELRGWGAIQNLFKDSKGNIDLEKAEIFQDKIGEFIAQAVNEKIERLNK